MRPVSIWAVGKGLEWGESYSCFHKQNSAELAKNKRCLC